MNKISKYIGASLLAAGMLFTAMPTGTVQAAPVSPAAVQNEATSLDVQGEAARQLAPDYATLSLAIETTANTVSAAKNRNDAVMSTLLANLQKLGIAKSDIRTASFSVDPIYNQDNKLTSRSYTVNNQVVVTINNLDKVSRVIDIAAQSGANRINGLSFNSRQQTALEDQLTTEAIKNARHKADVIAGALNLRVIGVKTVSVSDSRPVLYKEAMYMRAMAVNTSTPIEQGTVAVKKSVNITFLLGQ